MNPFAYAKGFLFYKKLLTLLKMKQRNFLAYLILIVLLGLLVFSAIYFVAEKRGRSSNNIEDSLMLEADDTQVIYLDDNQKNKIGSPPQITDEILSDFSKVARDLYPHNAKVCNRLDDASIVGDKIKISYEPDKTLSDIISDRGLEYQQGSILCKSLYEGVQFNFDRKYSLKEYTDGIMMLDNGNFDEKIIITSHLTFNIKTEEEFVQKRIEDSVSINNDFTSEIFSLGNYGLGYFIEYTDKYLHEDTEHKRITMRLYTGPGQIFQITTNIDDPKNQVEVFKIAQSVVPIKRDNRQGFQSKKGFLEYNPINISNWISVSDVDRPLSFMIPAGWVIENVDDKNRLSGGLGNPRDKDEFVSEVAIRDSTDPYELVSIIAYDMPISELVEQENKYPFKTHINAGWKKSKLNEFDVFYYINSDIKDTSFYLLYIGDDQKSYRLQSTIRDNPGVFENILLSMIPM